MEAETTHDKKCSMSLLAENYLTKGWKAYKR